MFAVSYGAQLPLSANRARCAAGGDRVVVVVPGQRGGNLSALTAHTLEAVGREQNGGSSKEQQKECGLSRTSLNRKEGVAKAKQSSTEQRRARHEGVVVLSGGLIGGGCLSADLGLPRPHRLALPAVTLTTLKLPYLDS